MENTLSGTASPFDLNADNGLAGNNGYGFTGALDNNQLLGTALNLSQATTLTSNEIDNLLAEPTVVAIARGNPTPPKASYPETVTNGDFLIQGNAIATLVGDGADEGTSWTFDLTQDPDFDSLTGSTLLASAQLTLTLKPTNGLITTDSIAIQGIGSIVQPIQELRVNETNTITINLLDYFSPDTVVQAIQANAGKLLAAYQDDANVSYAQLELATFDSGIFTVGDTGQVSVDFLVDGGKYEGELALFSLEGMGQYKSGSKEFIKEAARRALTNSTLGHVAIADPVEGARFSGKLPYEANFNEGEYTGNKSFAMNPGDRFGFMLVPNGWTSEVFKKPGIGSSKKPLFSMSGVNPGNQVQFAQLIDIEADGNSFAFEDLSLKGKSDRDYNDLIFQVRGAIAQAPLLDDVINRSKDWRRSDVGQQVITYAAANKYGPLSNMGSDLAELFVEYESYLREGGNPASFEPTNFLLQVQDGQVVIDAVTTGDTNILLADLTALGLQHSAAFESVVSGLLPIESINEVATLDSLTFASPAYRPITNVGLVDPQGNQAGNRAMNADGARAAFNVDGTGVTVGVISDSFNTSRQPIRAANDVATGDLPNNVRVLADGLRNGTDEGRAMLQIVHDVAPGANLAFHTGSLGSANFAQGIIDLADDGANIIVDDLYVHNQPMFQDGIIAQAVNRVVDRGISYFSSAGNYGITAYANAFNPSGQFFEGSIAHDFDPGPGTDIFQGITIPENTRFRLSLQWDSPFRTTSRSSQGATNDLAVYLVNAAGEILEMQDDFNIGRDAVEVLEFRNDPALDLGTQFSLVITNTNGVNPGLLKYQFFNPGVIVNEFTTNSPTIYGHANAAGAEALGAADYRETPNFGTNPAVLESFSSSGSTPILFDTAGNRLPIPEIRLKPEIVAPDGVNTTFFGADTNDPDAFPNFFGTSAAAPHAAAVAALMLQAVPGSSPANVYQALEETALDMSFPGIDNASGFGLIQADRAIERLRQLELSTVTISATAPTASENGDPGQFIVTRTDGNINRDLVVNYRYEGTAINGADYVESGSADLPPLPLDGTVLIPAGSTTAVIPITAIDDTSFERNETLDIILSQSQTYNVGAADRGTVTIADNDPPIGAVRVTIYEVTNLDDQEGAGRGVPDFYTWLQIADRRERTNTVSGNVISPNWSSSYFNELGNEIIPITINLQENDPRNPDDQVDLSPRPGGGDSKHLRLEYNIRTNEIIGDVSGFGGERLFASGESDGSVDFDDNDAEIEFSVDFAPIG